MTWASVASANRDARLVRQEAETVPSIDVMIAALRADGWYVGAVIDEAHVNFGTTAKQNQATDRAFRIGQKRNVLVHKFVCRGTVEERIGEMIDAKRTLSDAILAGGEEINLTELSDEALLRLVALDLDAAMRE